MVSLSTVQASNALINSTLPAGLVAVFCGGTSGIGEATLFEFTKNAIRPKVYIVGRSQDAANRNIAKCRMINKNGDYRFVKADLTLMNEVDAVCEQIKRQEKAVNILFLSQGQSPAARTRKSSHILCFIDMSGNAGSN